MAVPSEFGTHCGATSALRYGSGRSSFEKPNRWLFVLADHSSPPPVSVALSTGHTPFPCCPVEPQHGRFRGIRAVFRKPALDPGIGASTRGNAGLSDALGDVGTESTPGGHRRPTCPRSGTGSRMGDGTDDKGAAQGGDKTGAVSSSPRVGEGGPKGRMRGISRDAGLDNYRRVLPTA